MLSGAAMTLAYAPFEYWYIPFISLSTLLYFATTSKNAKQAAYHGFSFGIGWFGVGISWVHVAIADFGGLPLVASIALMVLLVSYLALFPALALWLFSKTVNRFGLFAFVLTWLFSEWLRSWALTGFPWLSIGYTQTSSPLSSFAAILGEFGLQAIVLLLVISLFNQRKLIAFTSYVFFIITGLALQQLNWTDPENQGNIEPAKQVTISLVQGNIEQSVKWQPENEVPTMLKYLNLSEPLWQSSDLVIWPEAAIPRLEVLAKEFLAEMDRTAAMNNSALVTGIVDFQPDTSLAFNNIIALGQKRADDEFGHYKYLHNNRYSKHHLLPVGEFVPFESLLRTLAPIFNLPMSSFSRGEYARENLVANGLNITPAICFEIAFSAQVRANIYSDSDFILTVSNDAWFGDSHGPWQHLQIAQMRAIEFAKPVVRVTNNGVTAFIARDGQIAASIEQNTADVLTQSLTLSRSKTFYYQYGKLPTLLFLLFAMLISIHLSNKRRY